MTKEERIRRMEVAAELEELQNSIAKANNEQVEKIETIIEQLYKDKPGTQL